METQIQMEKMETEMKAEFQMEILENQMETQIQMEHAMEAEMEAEFQMENQMEQMDPGMETHNRHCLRLNFHSTKPLLGSFVGVHSGFGFFGLEMEPGRMQVVSCKRGALKNPKDM